VKLEWDTIRSKVAWNGRFPVLVDEIRAVHDAREMSYTYLGIGSGAVVVLALDDEDHAICVRQYRHPMRQVVLELPAGHVDHGEDPIMAAYREFEEETGLQVRHLEHLGSYVPMPSLADFSMHMYFGHTLMPGQQQLDDTELLEIERVPIGKLQSAIITGTEPAVSMTYTVLLAAARGLLPAKDQHAGHQSQNPEFDD
jgi:ADP-ribose pyrophosphatase